MGILEIVFAVFLASVLIGSAMIALFALKTPKVPSLKGSDLSDFELPSAEEDRVISVVFGTRLIQPNLVWYGDFGRDKL